MGETATQPTVAKFNDSELARRVREATAAFNAAIDEAHAAGIQVDFGVSTWTSRPSKSHVENLRIERPSDWRTDYPGQTL
jgi:hypothetical protein